MQLLTISQPLELLWLKWSFDCLGCQCNQFLSYLFFAKKIPLSWRIGACYWWVNGWVSEWVSEWEMYVCHTNQIGSTTVLIRRNAFANGNGTDTEQVQEPERNGYRTDTEWIQNGYWMELERIRNDTNHKNGKKVFSRTQTIREYVLQDTWY